MGAGMIDWRHWLAAAALLAGLSEVRAALPLEAFAGLPAVDEVTLSPDGERYAALMNVGKETVLITRELMGSPPVKALLKTDNREFRFQWIRWVNNERLVMSVMYPSQRGWVEVAETRLLSIKRDGTGVNNLVRYSHFDDHRERAQFQDRVVDWLPEDGHHLLLQLTDTGESTPGVYRVDVDTGRRVPVQSGRSNVYEWITDLSHRVRVGIRQRDAQVEVLVCNPDGSNWRTAWSFGLFDREAVWPMGFGTDPNSLYVHADHEGRQGIFAVDLADPRLPRKLLLANERMDVGGSLMRAPGTHEVIGARVGLHGDATVGIWDEATKQLLSSIDQALPQRRNHLLELSEDGKRYLLYSSGNGVPGQYYVGLKDEGTLSLLVEEYPALSGLDLPRKRSLTIGARDGTRLPVLLTLPSGNPSPKGLPTVLLPHGGPVAMDSNDFDPLVQFLADRGYAVLQVNFRGSAGFGHAHMSAGLRRWGLEMQDDLTDAVKWLTESGVADPARVCIVGASYGGYAALMGGAKTPELYRCVVSFAGVSDLIDLGAHEAQFVNGRGVYAEQVGSLWSDRDRLKATSPSRLAGQFKAPVLLLHGTLDRSVPFEQSETMADALKSAGKRFRFVRQEGGDHHLSGQLQRTEFYREVEAFLGEHLAAPAAAAAPASR
ncbi:alpha/beta hydrolase family protein [Ideonella sp. YS5]|uniref:alpha/beta hydrolase family protein n=1 Tax=Ideonella sp. YS5 TaxID=3453714 RepID=UPI003EEE5951